MTPMDDIERELLDALRRELQAQDERLRMLAAYDTPNSRRLRQEISEKLADITERLTEFAATTPEPDANRDRA
jgi:hypothetical protein